MNCIRRNLLVLGLLVVLVFSLTGCLTNNDIYNIELVMDVSEVEPGRDYSLSTNFYVNDLIVESQDYEIVFSLEKGEEYAVINSKGTIISIDPDTPIGQEIVVKASCMEASCTYSLVAVKIPIDSVEIQTNFNKAIIDTDIILSASISPHNATYQDVEYIILEGEEYVYLNDNILHIERNAPIGEIITIQASCDSIVSNTISLEIDYIPVQSVNIYEANGNNTVSQGGTLSFRSSYYPEDSTYTDVEYYLEGIGDYDISIDKNTGILEVSSQVPEGYQFSVYAVIDEIISDYKSITVTQLVIEGVALYSDKQAVEIGGTVALSHEILPSNAVGINIAYEIIEGCTYAELIGNIIITDTRTPSGYVIKAIAYAYDKNGEIENTRSDVLEISVYKIDVQSVILTTSDKIEMVQAEETVVFGVDIFPDNATDQIAEYQIIQGFSYASIDRFTGVLEISKNNENQEIVIEAIVDGIKSNPIVVTTAMYYFDVSQSNWDDFDISGNLFRNYRNIDLDLAEMESDANLTTIVVPSYVKRLRIEGAYSKASPVVTTNLFFFFNNTVDIEITLVNVGIETTGYSNANIFDLPDGSNATFIIEGLCAIKAGNAIDPYFYAVDGEYEPGDNNFIFKKHGMSGHNGANGGTAIMGYNLRFEGSGKLTIDGGNGANGTPGGNGADVPAEEVTGVAGNGGKGGMGGDSGYAIYGLNITIELEDTASISASSGNAGKGGLGGEKGIAFPPANYGQDGEQGLDGKVFSAIAAYNILAYNSGNVYVSTGSINQTGWSVPEYETIWQIYNRIEKIYDINMHIMNDFATVSNYNMTRLTDETNVIFMLRMIDNVLSKFPTNIFREVWEKKEKQVELYVVDEIERGAIAGLAYNTGNTLWLAHSRPRIRNIFYSDVENFAFHELMHILKYPILNSFNENDLIDINNNYSYGSSSSIGVYNPSEGYGKYNGYFLSAYSRTNWYEDVCETFSLIARLSRDYDFLDSGAPIRTKIIYISTRLSLNYGTCGTYKEEYWERLL